MFENYLSSCRFCLENIGEHSLFEDNVYSELLMNVCSISISDSDNMPSFICENCSVELNQAYNFKKKVENSIETLQIYVQSLALSNSQTEDSIQDDESFTIETLDYNALTTIAKSETNLTVLEENDNENENDQIIINTNDNSIEIYKDVSDDQFHLLSDDDGLNVKQEYVIEYIEKTDEFSSNEHEGNNLIDEINDADEILEIEEINDFSVKSQKEEIKEKQKAQRRERAKHQDRKHVCSECKKSFIYKSNLENHMRIHSGDKPFFCDICDLRFAQKGHLDIHHRTHTGFKPYRCNVCTKSFSINQTLMKHYKIHTDERNYSCTYCTKAFRTSYHLSNHVKRHLGEKNFVCDWPDCTLRFVANSELKRHKLKHFKNQNKLLKYASRTNKNDD